MILGFCHKALLVHPLVKVILRLESGFPEVPRHLRQHIEDITGLVAGPEAGKLVFHPVLWSGDTFYPQTAGDAAMAGLLESPVAAG